MQPDTVITVQCVPHRLKYIKKVLHGFDAIYHVDNYTSPMNSFKEMLKIPVKDYRLHLQDDIIIADHFDIIIPYLARTMHERNIDLLSLFVPPRPTFEKKVKNSSESIVEMSNFLWMPGCMFSKRLVDLMAATETDEKKHDDVFVGSVLKKHGIKPYVHNPSLVQHNIKMESVLKHFGHKSRVTKLFDRSWVPFGNVKIFS